MSLCIFIDDIIENFSISKKSKFFSGICFIGNNLRLPNPKALDTSKRLIKWLVESGKIPENYTLKGHRDLRPTESPGQLLYQEIQNWPHYRQTAQYQK